MQSFHIINKTKGHCRVTDTYIVCPTYYTNESMDTAFCLTILKLDCYIHKL